MSGRRSARIRVLIHVSRTIRIRISRAVVVRRRSAGPPAVCRACGRLPLRPVILRSWLIRPLLILIGPLLRLAWPLLILVSTLLILVLPKILLTILPRLHLNITELPLRSATVKSALAGHRDNAQAEKQDCSSHRRRTHSFRVGNPVHESFSRQAAEMVNRQSPFWLPVSASI